MSWFEPNIIYEGYGRAEFENPKGFVEGPFKIEFDELGNRNIELLRVQRFVNGSAQGSEFDLEHLLTGIAPKRLGGGWTIPWLGPVNNVCTKLTVDVEKPGGYFVCLSNIHHYPMSISANPGDLSVLFDAKLSEFTCSENREGAKYWVQALINFVADFVQMENARSPHPLRINPLNPLIKFVSNDATGFIEPLEDYEDRKRKLIAHQAPMLLTTIMVGDINEKPLAYDRVQDWLPYDFLDSVLGLSSGSRVATGWIEFRDAGGQLVKRLHVPVPKLVFQRGHAAVRSYHAGSIGSLLSNGQTSPFFRSRELRIVINQLVEAGFDTRTIEDRLSLIFRAFEALADILDIKATSPKTVLPGNRYNEIKQILENAKNQIKELAESLGTDSNSREDLSAAEQQRLQFEKEMIERIANRVDIPLNMDRGFHEVLSGVANRFAFSDIDVALKKFSEREWREFVTSAHRSKVMHGRSFMDSYTLEQGWRFLYHLQDMGIRAVLKLLEYEGTYTPVVAKIPGAHVSIDTPLDWVTPACGPEDLGYI